MLNYRKILDWHKCNDVTVKSSSSDTEAEQLETQLQTQYIHRNSFRSKLNGWGGGGGF